MSEADIWDSGDGNLLREPHYKLHPHLWVQAGMPSFERKSSEHSFQAQVAQRFERNFQICLLFKPRKSLHCDTHVFTVRIW